MTAKIFCVGGGMVGFGSAQPVFFACAFACVRCVRVRVRFVVLCVGVRPRADKSLMNQRVRRDVPIVAK